MLTATSEKSIGARRFSTSRIWINAQLSLPPESPIITRSPSSIRPWSVIARVTFLAMRDSSSDAYGMAIRSGTSRALPLYELAHGFGPCQLRAGLVRPSAHPFRQRGIVRQPPQRARKRIGGRVADEAVHVVPHELGRPAGIAARDDRPARREGLHRDEPVVLLQRWKQIGRAHV